MLTSDCNSSEYDGVVAKLKMQRIETPSWGYADSGTRFRVFSAPDAAKTLDEKLQAAASVHRLTGIAKSIALHIPWDKTADWAALSSRATDLGIQIGAINPNLFQDEDYKLGSLCNPSVSVRQKALKHCLECIEIMKATGSDILSLWLADGTNYAGQDSILERKRRLREGLETIYDALPEGTRLLLEYKFFEPAFYHTDVADWGTAFALCQSLGERAQVLVDTGHHAPGTNIAYIVTQLLEEGKLGGFHFNSRHYADDDLIVGSANPWELFLIFCELVSAGPRSEQVAYMIDQSHNIEPKIEAMVLSVMNCQTAYAKALLVPYDSLSQLQIEGDVLSAHRILAETFSTDVRPLIERVRLELGCPTDPFEACRSRK